ncbi:uncharacterized protein N7469_006359 [Penicillium citrinum]|uniref:Zn(2)-C6 fungal-type domain-containing protein n=2 Tax=Penicillium TaxID=5073 RepID=A0A9W9TMB7_PENCI|nr:uncharacterized protein N7469_006359 [Penicillium citrinum]KAJ5231771.1 hypothetical protein N7469_006359 [Penicillium citrinum]
MAARSPTGDISQFDETYHNPLPKLPACRFCHGRKAKCDNNRPKCSLCVKHGEECMTLAVEDSEPIAREYIGNLEQEIRDLEAELEASRSFNSPSTPPPASRDAPIPEYLDSDGSRRAISLSKRKRQSPSFVEGGGISFMRHLFADSAWREHDPTLLRNLSRGSGPVGTGVKPNALPSAQEARDIFNRYVNGSHIQRPFFLRSDLEKLYARVFSEAEGSSDMNLASKDSHDLYRTFMILAIGSVISYRNGATLHHPYGYYVSAMKYLDDSFLARGLESIQDLLLIGSSITLDRPFAIPDTTIQVGFPADADDEEIEAAERSGSFPDLDSYCTASSITSPPKTRNTEMSVLLACLRLRQITSQIHAEFGGKAIDSHAGKNIMARGLIYSKLDFLLDQLRQWRCSSPVFDHPRCLYEMQEWHQLLYLREQLLLIRKAIDLVPKRNNSPPRDLLSLCLRSAVDAISIFCRLFRDRKITFTRSYFQMLFTAGLSVMYCLSVVKDFDLETVLTGTQSVRACEDALKQIVEELPDAKHYLAVYEALRAHVVRKYTSTINFPSQSQPDSRTAESILQQQDSEVSSEPLLSAYQAPVLTAPTSSFHSTHPSYDSQFLQGELDVMSMTNSATQIHTRASVSEGSILSLDIFGDDALWDMEAGLSEYACGDPPASLYLENPFDVHYHM